MKEQLSQHILACQSEIEAWFEQKWKVIEPPIYGSVDLRHAGFKTAPVDMNLFPAGFNNLSSTAMPMAVEAVQQFFSRYYSNVSKILLVSENHTRNPFYFEHLSCLREIIQQAGFDVRVHALSDLQRRDNRLVVEHFDADLIWLNHDLSNGVPDILQNVEQPICPSITLGWGDRLKSIHFAHYQSVAEELANLVGIDSWLIAPLFRACRPVNFLKREGMSCLLENAHALFDAIQAKYDAYHIDQKPFVVVKADSGTYGMGVMMISDPNELVSLNRKQRTHMSSSKGGGQVDRVILQEGVPTVETLKGAVVESVLYMIGQSVVGGFYRAHQHRGACENLNSPGMYFEPFESPNYFYTVLARLSLLAAGQELIA